MKAAIRGIVWQWQCDYCYRYFGPKSASEADLPNFPQMIADGWSIGRVHGDVCPSCISDGVQSSSERHTANAALEAVTVPTERDSALRRKLATETERADKWLNRTQDIVSIYPEKVRSAYDWAVAMEALDIPQAMSDWLLDSGRFSEERPLPQSTVPTETEKNAMVNAWYAQASRWHEEGITSPATDAAWSAGWEAHAALANQPVPTENEREALQGALTNVLSNASNYPEKVQSRILGQNMGPLNAKVADAIQARGFRLPVPVEEDKPRKFTPEQRAELIAFTQSAIQSVWDDVGATTAEVLAGNVVSAQEFAWLSMHFPVAVQVDPEWEYGTQERPGRVVTIRRPLKLAPAGPWEEVLPDEITEGGTS